MKTLKQAVENVTFDNSLGGKKYTRVDDVTNKLNEEELEDLDFIMTELEVTDITKIDEAVKHLLDEDGKYFYKKSRDKGLINKIANKWDDIKKKLFSII